MPGDVACQDGVGRDRHFRAVAVLHGAGAGQVAQIGDIGMRQDRGHAGHGAGLVETRQREARMGVARAQHLGHQCALGDHVAGIATRAGEKALIFPPVFGAWPMPNLRCCETIASIAAYSCLER